MSSGLMRKISWWHGILIRRSKQNAANETLPGGRSVGVDGRFIGQRAAISSRNAVRLAAATARGKISFIGRRLKLDLEKREDGKENAPTRSYTLRVGAVSFQEIRDGESGSYLPLSCAFILHVVNDYGIKKCVISTPSSVKSCTFLSMPSA